MTGRTLVVTGAAGMLGREVVRVAAAAGYAVRALARADLDVTDAAACRTAVEGADVVVGCAAWTAVDDAEEQEGAAFDVNARGAANLAGAAALAGAALVHVSTDYVFDGRADHPYLVDDPVAPASAYGRTKAAGEWAVRAASDAHRVVRTAWLYGDGPCFPRTAARLLAERGGMQVVDDQVGQPTSAADLAEVLVALADPGVPGGTYHAVSAGRGSWFDLAREVAASAGHPVDAVQPVPSDRFPRPAPRPAWSVLDTSSLARVGVAPIGDWRERWHHHAAAVLATDPSAQVPAP